VSRVWALAVTGLASALLLSQASAATARTAVAQAGLDCLQTAQSTAAMDACVGAQYASASKQLNAAYAKLLAGKGLAPGDRKLLAQSERAWLSFRAADCAYAESLDRGGTLSAVTKGICLVRDTTDRANALRDYLSTS
jgi:uncharacterized protein YecT (DUF1311 family)